ncbi:MAG: SIMPL domain-containing protein [Nitrososphaerota archaeon]|nr:SIMPL domain-containing protein [Nitrososphaerota archaeon]
MQKTGRISALMIVLLVVVVLLAFTTIYMAFLLSQPNTRVIAQTTTASSANTITVSGVGQVSYTPNEALIQVSVETENSSAAAATALNAATVASVIKALNGIGISNSSIQTQGYSLSTDYSNCYGPCIPKIVGYSVTNSLQVNVTSNDAAQLGVNAGHVIDTAVNAGATGINLYFAATSSAMTQLTNQALQMAVSSASSQAHVIATSLGVSITGVISSTVGSYYPQPYYGQVVYAATTLATPNVSTPIIPGTQTISETVQVVYAIS